VCSYRIFLPSGVQDGSFETPSLVICVTLPPLTTGTVQRLTVVPLLVWLALRKAIFVPSGEKLGLLPAAICMALPPVAALTTYMYSVLS